MFCEPDTENMFHIMRFDKCGQEITEIVHFVSNRNFHVLKDKILITISKYNTFDKLTLYSD